MKKLKLLDTFSGIGGFSYAAEKLVGGFETTQFVENDPYCQKVLKKHWPNVPIHDDIRTFTAEPFQFDAVCGGFPCQDISTAGRGKGITKETRSGLFYELIRIVRMVRPKYVILENVAAILNNGLDIVLGELSEAGYDAEWAVISASSLGACHQRSRWFCVAYPNSKQSSGTKNQIQSGRIFSSSSIRSGNVAYPNNNGSFATEKSRSAEKTDGGAEERQNETCQSQRGSESRDTKTIQLNATDPDSLRTQSKNYKPNNASWKMPISDGKTKRTLNPNWRGYVSKCVIRRGDDGLRGRMDRLKALGNSVVPQVAAIPLQRVKDIHEQLTSVDR